MSTAGKCLGNCGPNVHVYKSTASQVIALTIDDVPSRCVELFEQLLDILCEEKVCVTFMVIGEYVRISDRHKAAMVRAVKEGHLLVNHMMRDEAATTYDRERFIQELDECQGLISHICELAGVVKPGRANGEPCLKICVYISFACSWFGAATTCKAETSSSTEAETRKVAEDATTNVRSNEVIFRTHKKMQQAEKSPVKSKLAGGLALACLI